MTFAEWLEHNIHRVPLINWGPMHTKIAEMYAKDVAAKAVRRTLDEALNRGDGSYRP